MKINKAFTLVELIVVIMVLAILWIVWMYTMASYLVSVRDSTRTVELENMETSLGSYILKSWFYPDPTWWAEVSYSWQTLWTQWIFWEEVAKIVWYSKKPNDPLTNKFYTYSLKNSRKEYSLAWVVEERPWLVSWVNISNSAYADKIWSKKWYAIVKWNYNGEVLSITLNWSTNVLAIPSIIATDLLSTDIVDILNNNRLVYNDFENLPSSYSWTVFNVDSNIDFSPNKLKVFSWSISDLKKKHIIKYNYYKMYIEHIVEVYYEKQFRLIDLIILIYFHQNLLQK